MQRVRLATNQLRPAAKWGNNRNLILAGIVYTLTGQRAMGGLECPNSSPVAEQPRDSRCSRAAKSRERRLITATYSPPRRRNASGICDNRRLSIQRTDFISCVSFRTDEIALARRRRSATVWGPSPRIASGTGALIAAAPLSRRGCARAYRRPRRRCWSAVSQAAVRRFPRHLLIAFFRRDLCPELDVRPLHGPDERRF